MQSTELLKAQIALTVTVLNPDLLYPSTAEALAAVEAVIEDTCVDLDSPALTAADVAGLVDMTRDVLVTRLGSRARSVSV